MTKESLEEQSLYQNPREVATGGIVTSSLQFQFRTKIETLGPDMKPEHSLSIPSKKRGWKILGGIGSAKKGDFQ